MSCPDCDLPPGQDEMVRTGQIGLLCALLQRFCEDNALPFMSADDLARHVRDSEYSPEYQPQINAILAWLETYSRLWDLSDLTETD